MKVKLSELIAEVGDENVGLQNLDTCGITLDWKAKSGTKITFGTDQPLDTEGTKQLGLVVWLDRDAVAASMAKNKAEPA